MEDIVQTQEDSMLLYLVEIMMVVTDQATTVVTDPTILADTVEMMANTTQTILENTVAKVRNTSTKMLVVEHTLATEATEVKKIYIFYENFNFWIFLLGSGAGGAGGAGAGGAYTGGSNFGSGSGSRFGSGSGSASGSGFGAGRPSSVGSGISAAGFGAPVAQKTGSAAGLYDNKNYGIVRQDGHVDEDGYHYL